MMQQLRYILLFFLFLLPFCHLNAINDGSRYTEKSVLSEGKWIQLKVTENAVYKLTFDEIKKMGFSDPSKVKIYGYGGWILDEDFSKPYVDDLPEVSVYLSKGNDGVFNSGDFLLFYGRGPQKWSYNASSDVFSHENNPYSTFGSYYITENENGPKEMSMLSSFSGTANETHTIFDDYALHERDSIYILASGRELFGESFVGSSTVSRSFYFDVPGITPDAGKACLSFAGAPKSGTSTPVYLSIDDKELLTLSISGFSDSYRKARLGTRWVNWNNTKNERTKVTVSYNAAGQGIANLNYIVLNMKRALKFYGKGYTFFRNKKSLQNHSKYLVENANSSCMIWDISGNFNTYRVPASLSGNQLTFSTEANASIREYAMVDVSKPFPSPQVVGEVKNQNLHGLPQTDMVIIVPEVYSSYAELLAEKHRTADNLHVTVVQDNWIYNEFSSGVKDATAYRRFMKMFYDRAATDDKKPRYLLLFGDCVFDNRHLTSQVSKMDPKYYLLSYQVMESVYETESYGTDDYFGFLDDNEGTALNTAKLDIGIGRFPVSSVQQAANAVNKVIAYMENSKFGNWKNKLVITADNTDTDGTFCSHATQAEELSTYMEATHPEYMVDRYYLDAYKSTVSNGKTTYPDVKKAFLNTMNDGCFLVNYTGHGNTTGWSGEDLLQISDVRNMTSEHLPLWITATCDFGWHDGVTVSGGEEAFLNKNGAGIAAFTTSRVVVGTYNSYLNRYFLQYLFEKENGEYVRLGDVFRKSKVEMVSKYTSQANFNKLNFVLLGDPALRLNYPEYYVELRSVNGIPTDGSEEILFKALDRITLEGVVTDVNGNTIDDFNGNLRTTAFDSKQTIQSVSQSSSGAHFYFDSYPNMLYLGNNEVKNGTFNFSFNVPLDISYERNNGKISFYAYDENSDRDANGSFSDYLLAGTSDNPSTNENGPEIVTMFLNNENFRDGDRVNETPYFYAVVSDEDGINMTSSASGHGITIIIDNNPKWTYALNSYYNPISAMDGSVGFSIPALPTGKHTLLFRVWDILNNMTTDTLTFEVVEGGSVDIVDLYASVNPAKATTSFMLAHDLPETQLNVEVRVYDLTGRTVWSHAESGSSGFLKEYPIEWNLTNNAGQRVMSGIYVYRASVRTDSGKKATKAKKIIVLGQ